MNSSPENAQHRVSRSSAISPSKKVSNACQRCRRQKLKCDVQRPCTLCVRADAHCVDHQPNLWKPYSVKEVRRKDRSKQLSQDRQPAKRSRIAEPSQSRVIGPGNDSIEFNGDASKDAPSHEAPISGHFGYHGTAAEKSSSTVNLIGEAFQYHSSNTPPQIDTSAFSRQLGAVVRSPLNPASRRRKFSKLKASTSRLTPSTAQDLFDILPEREPAVLLLNTYFDRVHWFMLVFYQDEFRANFEKLYSIKHNQRSVATEFLGFTSTLLAAFVIALQHAGTYRKRLLQRQGVEPEELKNRILVTLKSNLMDILSLGSLESVQTCVLLGSYYLYHGHPELAWPVCGCALRIAQALGLHREQPTRLDSEAQSPTLIYQRNQARKRTWWAVYEIETISSMLYGYPLSISDGDCNIKFLVLSSDDQQNGGVSGNLARPGNKKATLLSYKHFMSRLTVIVRDVLDQLYRKDEETSNSGTQSESRNFRLQRTINKVFELEDRLQAWESQLPSDLCLSDRDRSVTSYHNLKDIDQDIGASGEVFETHLFHFQALALRLACDNTRILIHRPLLSYQLINQIITGDTQKSSENHGQISDPFSHSLRKCRDAAFRSSEVGKSEVFSFASTTYAAAFFGMHLFTAGVTLCIMASLKPLSTDSHECKLAVHRIMTMQSPLKDTSVLAAQGLNVLEKLTMLILEQEKRKMFEFPTSSVEDCSTQSSQPSPQTRAFPKPTEAEQSDDRDSSKRATTGQDQTHKILPSHEVRPSQSESAGHSLPGTDYEQLDFFNMDFQENFDMTRALQDVEQVMANDYSHTIADNSFSYSSDLTFDNDFVEQEQGWMWTFDFFQNS